MLIQHEGDEGALQAGTGAAEHVEAALGQLHATLEVDDIQGRPQIPVGLGLKALGGEVARGAPAAHLGVVVLVLADGGGGVAQVRHAHQQGVQGVVGLGAGGAGRLQLLVDLAHLLLGGLGLVLLALAHERADLLGDAVALGLQGLLLGNQLAALNVKGGELLGIEGRMAVLHSLGYFVEMFTYVLDVQHRLLLGVGRFASDQYSATIAPGSSQGGQRAERHLKTTDGICPIARGDCVFGGGSIVYFPQHITDPPQRPAGSCRREKTRTAP